MTIAFIVACKDSYYMVSDSLTSGDEVYSLNTRKSFLSEKHKLGMCISGEAVLKHQNITKDSEVLYTDYVINEFFENIDSLEKVSVTELNSNLENFFNEKYKSYWKFFKTHVSYFYGGFVPDSSGGLVSEIYMYYGGENEDAIEKSYTWKEEDSENNFFSNTNSVQIYLKYTLAHPEAPGITIKNFLSDLGYREKLLTYTLPHACLAVNKEEPCTIGSYLYYYRLSACQDMKQKIIKYKEAATDLGLQCELLSASDCPPFKMYRSIDDSNKAYLSGELIKYKRENGEEIAVSLEQVGESSSIPSP